MENTLLSINGISKTFGSRPALTDVSFDVGNGRLTGFVGANGAGKTTTMRIILGVLSSDRGSVSLDGSALGPDDRRRFGYMPEERGLYPKMKVHEQIVYLARLHGLGRKSADANATRLLDRLGLGERANDTVESLSLGNQQRAQIAAALVHEPEVLILDEPFSGLDPLAVEVVLGVLQEAAAGGAPVLFSSHQLDLVERLCDDLIVIAGGRIKASGSREKLRAENSGRQFEILAGTDVAWLRDVAGITVLDFDGGYALFEADADGTAQAVLKRALELGPVASFAPRHPSLTQIFKEVVA